MKAVLHGLGKLNVKFQLLLLKVKFYKRLFFKTGLLHDVLWFDVLSDCDDKCSKTVFIPLHTAVNNVMSEFLSVCRQLAYFFVMSVLLCFFFSLCFIIIFSSPCIYLSYLFLLSACFWRINVFILHGAVQPATVWCVYLLISLCVARSVLATGNRQRHCLTL